MSEQREKCANCGKVYSAHMESTHCEPGGRLKWFPKKIADALESLRGPTTPHEMAEMPADWPEYHESLKVTQRLEAELLAAKTRIGELEQAQKVLLGCLIGVQQTLALRSCHHGLEAEMIDAVQAALHVTDKAAKNG